MRSERTVQPLKHSMCSSAFNEPHRGRAQMACKGSAVEGSGWVGASVRTGMLWSTQAMEAIQAYSMRTRVCNLRDRALQPVEVVPAQRWSWGGV